MNTDTDNNNNTEITDSNTLQVSLEPPSDITHMLNDSNNIENTSNVDDDNDTQMLNNTFATATDQSLMDDANATLAMHSPSAESAIKLANHALNTDPGLKAQCFKDTSNLILRRSDNTNYDNTLNNSANAKLVALFNDRESHYKRLLQEKDFIIRNANIDRSFQVEHINQLRGIVKRLKAEVEKLRSERGVDNDKTKNNGLGAANKKKKDKSMIIPKKVNNGLNKSNGNNSNYAKKAAQQINKKIKLNNQNKLKLNKKDDIDNKNEIKTHKVKNYNTDSNSSNNGYTPNPKRRKRNDYNRNYNNYQINMLES